LPPLALAGEFKILMAATFAQRAADFNSFPFPKKSRPPRRLPAKSPGARMKAKIIITPKKAVVDPQGITVLKALEHMGHRGIKAVHVGKYLEIELDATDKEAARKSLDEASHKFLSNPVIEDYRLEIE
jgi:phosphoribosylformylglycinamidine synthase